MVFHFLNRFPQLKPYWDKYLPYQQRLEVPAKTTLLQEGQVSQQYMFIEQGCVRAFFYKDGDDKTVQFFFEKDGFSALDSFINEVPSLFTMETIEHSVIYVLPKAYVCQLIDELSQEAGFLQLVLQMTAIRQKHYNDELVGFIRDTPEQRYHRLLTERPHIIRRVPQHYIASYLGVSSVHLSRIRNKLAKGKAHF